MTCNTRTVLLHAAKLVCVLLHAAKLVCVLVSSTATKGVFVLDQTGLWWAHMHLVGPCHCNGPVDNASDE